jgi:hypothetical protein
MTRPLEEQIMDAVLTEYGEVAPNHLAKLDKALAPLRAHLEMRE